MTRSITIQAETIEAAMEEILSGSRIFNEQLEVRFGKQSYPIIIPSTGVELLVNGIENTKRTIVGPADIIECKAVNKDSSSTFHIHINEEKMIATAVVTPGKRVIRSLRDIPWKPVLPIEVNEKIDVYNDLTTNQLLEELYSMGIGENLSTEGVRQAVTTLKDTEIVVAAGTPPVKSQDAYLDIQFKSEKEQVDEELPIDFREHNFIPTVKAGELIAIHVAAVRGVNGRNVVGKEYKVKPLKDIILRPGTSVYQVLHKLYAKIDGRPVIEWRGRVAKVYVNREYRHATDVNLESGNIHFDGDVWIGGSVHPSMFIAASGMITIMKNCTKSSIRGTKSVFVNGSIFSSTVTVGIQEKAIAILVKGLSEILDYLRKIESALVQIFTLRGEDREEVAPFLSHFRQKTPASRNESGIAHE